MLWIVYFLHPGLMSTPCVRHAEFVGEIPVMPISVSEHLTFDAVNARQHGLRLP